MFPPGALLWALMVPLQQHPTCGTLRRKRERKGHRFTGYKNAKKNHRWLASQTAKTLTCVTEDQPPPVSPPEAQLESAGLVHLHRQHKTRVD